MRIFLSVALGVFVCAALARAETAAPKTSNPFDPKTYIETKEQRAAAASNKITSKSIFRIDGRRYQKLMTSDGAVFLPSVGAKVDVMEEFALCEHHLKLLREVIPMRENIPVEPEILKDEAAIVVLVRKCKEGRIKGPTLVIENPDGSKVEVKAKEDKDPPSR